MTKEQLDQIPEYLLILGILHDIYVEEPTIRNIGTMFQKAEQHPRWLASTNRANRGQLLKALDLLTAGSVDQKSKETSQSLSRSLNTLHQTGDKIESLAAEVLQEYVKLVALKPNAATLEPVHILNAIRRMLLDLANALRRIQDYVDYNTPYVEPAEAA